MKDLIDHVKQECTPIDREKLFDQMLDETYDFADVGGPFSHMVPSRVLKEMDPTAYHCGVNDYTDSLDTYEIECETYLTKDVDEARDEFVSDLEDELSGVEDDISDIESESGDADHSDTDEYERLMEERDDLSERIEEARSYQF